MTINKFTDMLKSTGIVFAYHHFLKPQKLPFGAWAITGEPDLFADNEHYVLITDAYVEYYYKSVNLADETKIKKAFNDNKVSYKFEYRQWIDEEKMYVTRWMVNFIGG